MIAIRSLFRHIVAPCALALAFSAGCSSDEAAKKDADTAAQTNGPGYTTTKEGELIVEKFTLDDDEKPDVIKYFEEYPDPDDDKVLKRRIRKKEVDVNSDGTIDIVRLYDKEGTPTEEKVDVDLDGTFDAKAYYDQGEMVRKEMLSEDERIVETRFYKDGTITRVEKDLNNDEKVDYWEYYEEGTLDRIGRDMNADGAADKWTRR